MSLLLRAFLASFTVYLLPIFAPHIVMPLGLALIQEIASGRDHKDPLWIAADVALVLLLQTAAGALWLWFFRSRGRLRFLGLVASVPLFFTAAELGYMLAIPSFFLIERDRTEDIEQWPEACRLPGYVVPPMGSSRDMALPESGQVWVMQADDYRLGVMHMPDCRLRDLDQPWSNAGTVPVSAAPDGRLLLVTYARDGEESWDVLKNGEKMGPFPRPPGTGYERAMLSNDAEWIGWIQRGPPGDTARVLLQRVSGGEERFVELSGVGTGRFGLLAVDATASEILLEQDHGAFLAVDWEGRLRWGPVVPERVEASGESFLRVGEGWVAWDAYRDRGAYRVEWSLAHGSGYHEVLKGRHITSLAADPEGRFIALSISTALNIGSFGDKVYVIRASDGDVVFQETQPRYARSQVAFLTSRHFAYTAGRDVRVLVTRRGKVSTQVKSDSLDTL